MFRRLKQLLALSVLAVGISQLAWGQEPAANLGDAGQLTQGDAEKLYKARPYSPYAERSFPTRPLFGDTHVHTDLSMDAGAAGCRLGPADAYRFAKGEEVMSSTGQPAKLARPLDFLVVTDHSDNMGFFTDLIAGKPELLAVPEGRRWYDMMQSGQGQQAMIELVGLFSQG